MDRLKESVFAQAISLRDLARRARRLSQSLSQEHDRQRLLGYADELDDDASRLEKQATPPKDPG